MELYEGTILLTVDLAQIQVFHLSVTSTSGK